MSQIINSKITHDKSRSESNRSAFFISDGTGITAETLGHSLLAQFEQSAEDVPPEQDRVKFDTQTIPYVDTPEKAKEVIVKINRCFQRDHQKPILFATIINPEIRKIFAGSNGFIIDIFSTFLNPLENELNLKSSYSVGRGHSILNDHHYNTRMEAVNFALDNDDGARTRHYNAADVIVVGVSRCGKTPTCLYLAMQFGIKAANYPFTEDDFDDLKIPKVLRPYKNKLFGLIIDADRLVSIRHERKPNSQYASYKQCDFESRSILALFNRENIPHINSTHASIEEIATRLMAVFKLERKIH